MDYRFTDDTVKEFSTSLTNIPIKRSHEPKIRVKAGESLNLISMSSLLDLLTIAARRVDLDIGGIDIIKIKRNA